MMFAKARIIALVIGAGLVGSVSFANAQIAVVTEKLNAFKSASQELENLFVVAEAIEQVGGEKGIAAKGAEAEVDAAIKRRDAAAKELGDAIAEAMKTMDPTNQQDGKRLEEVFDEIEEINKTVADTQLRYSDMQAIINEQTAAGAEKQ
jgi:uncharacterized protein YicC (UPF0701 family)